MLEYQKKINLLLTVLSILLSVLGAVWFLNQFGSYKSSYKTLAKIEKISDTDLCRISYRQCKYSRKIELSFLNFQNEKSVASTDLSTITLIATALQEGDTVKILYRPSQRPSSVFDTLVKNLGPMLYEDVQVYTWLYWAYPILIVLSGPILFALKRKWDIDYQLKLNNSTES